MISVEINVFSIHLNLLSIDFSFQLQKHIDKKGFQLKSIYVQLLCPLNFKRNIDKQRFSIEINLFAIHLNLLSIGFPFQSQRNLLIRISIEVNLLSIALNLLSSSFSAPKKSIDKKGLQLKPIYFQFMSIRIASFLMLST